MKNMILPPTSTIIPSYAKAVTKVVDPTSTPSRYGRSLGYDRFILSFVDGEMKEGIEHVSDKGEEGMEDDNSYKAFVHDYTLITLNVLITLWTLIWMSNFLL